MKALNFKLKNNDFQISPTVHITLRTEVGIYWWSLEYDNSKSKFLWDIIANLIIDPAKEKQHNFIINHLSDQKPIYKKIKFKFPVKEPPKPNFHHLMTLQTNPRRVIKKLYSDRSNRSQVEFERNSTDKNANFSRVSHSLVESRLFFFSINCIIGDKTEWI